MCEWTCVWPGWTIRLWTLKAYAVNVDVYSKLHRLHVWNKQHNFTHMYTCQTWLKWLSLSLCACQAACRVYCTGLYLLGEYYFRELSVVVKTTKTFPCEMNLQYSSWPHLLALVRATLVLLSLSMNPTWWVLTEDSTIISFSPPWKASTVETWRIMWENTFRSTLGAQDAMAHWPSSPE